MYHDKRIAMSRFLNKIHAQEDTEDHHLVPGIEGCQDLPCSYECYNQLDKRLAFEIDEGRKKKKNCATELSYK